MKIEGTEAMRATLDAMPAKVRTAIDRAVEVAAIQVQADTFASFHACCAMYHLSEARDRIV